MRKVAELAGVSISTVSRVVNSHPNITAETARNVRTAMEKLDFRPTIRRPTGRTARTTGSGSSAPVLSAAIVMFNNGGQMAPAYEQLLQGISQAADECRLNLVFGFARDMSQLPPRVLEGGVDGLLLGGTRPSPDIQERLHRIPSVWLMGNRQRPRWGDQVMPDNTTIAQIAARYLLDRGHTHLACLMSANSGWSLYLRALAFSEAVRERGAIAHVLKAVEPPQNDEWCPDSHAALAKSQIDQLLALSPRPTGLFISEDRLVSAIDRELTARGIDCRPGSGIDVISCNNEREYLAGLHMSPASIDINAASIGRRAVELLVKRIRKPDDSGRTRVMVGPRLIDETSVAQISENVM
ncbi:MAG: LacI family DNA-binding transcriptional regulator [Pyrinomonadaceae bacterium]|nr:LacI family DNA-binding transcriptional regulator [Phycisphaerales bacterium]